MNGEKERANFTNVLEPGAPSGRLGHFQTNRSHEQREEKWVHLDRIAGGDRRHRNFGGAAAARTVQVEKPHPDHRLLEQPPATFNRLATLYRR